MLPVIPKPAITRRQKNAALAVAGAIDLLQVVLLPLLGLGYVLDDVLDAIAAIALVAICGFKWQFVLAFLLELVPPLDLLPTWTAVVLTLAVRDEGSVGVAKANIQGGEHPPIQVSAVVVPPVQATEVQK